ncbi:MAG: hypothetical protein KDA24_14440 [Deltaproteobacteria bacterium]|nr:hypothetical protein [Deltaproteobacteria bacterium]
MKWLLAPAAVLMIGCASSEPELHPLPAAPVSLSELPPPKERPSTAPNPLLVIDVDGLDAALCAAPEALPSSLAEILLGGCAPVSVGEAGIRGDRASLITGVGPGVHGVFADSEVVFAPEGERTWPRGPRRAPHVWTPLLERRQAVAVIGLPHDYPPTRAEHYTHLVGAVLPAPPLPPLVDGLPRGAQGGPLVGESSVPGVSLPFEVLIDERRWWTRRWTDGRGQTEFVPLSSHPATPSRPLAWPPVAALELWEAGIALRTGKGPVQGSGDAVSGLLAIEAHQRVQAALALCDRGPPSLLWLSLSGVHPQGLDPVSLAGVLAPLLKSWTGSVALVSLRGRASPQAITLPSTLEEGLSWTGPGTVRLKRGTPPARARGLLARAEATLEVVDGVHRLIRGSEIEGPRAGLAPGLQLLPEPGRILPGDRYGAEPGLLAGSMVVGDSGLRPHDLARLLVAHVNGDAARGPEMPPPPQ